MIYCFLIDLKYTQIYTDNSVFKKRTLIIVVYIDNILLCELNKNKILDLKIKLSNYFKITDCETCKYYLEMLITQNRTLQTFILLQKIYFTEMLKDFSLQNIKTVIILMKFRAYLTKIIRTAKLELITQY